MKYLMTKFADLRQLFATDSLFRNAVYLMGSTAIMSVLGFGFWLFVAHLYSPAQIGAASALISISLLISNLSFLGLNSGLVRFLPVSKTPGRDINAALITVMSAAVVAATVYCLFGGSFDGQLAVFDHGLFPGALFVALMAAVSLNTLTDSVFIANRRAEYHTIVYTVFGLIKLVLPLFLIPLGSLGIFGAYIAAVVVSLVLSLYFMWRSCGYRLLSRPNWKFVADSRKYNTHNYVGVLLAGLPSQLMPSMILGRLGSEHAAYFSMAWTMANLLYVIPSAMTNSLLAEGSHDIAAQAHNVSKAVRILALVLVPAVLLAVVVAPYLLTLFGPQYAAGGTAIFQLLAVTTFFVAANSVGNTILNLEHRSGGIVVVQAVIAATSLGLGWVLLDWNNLGLAGVGLAMLGGAAAGGLVHLGLMAGLGHRADQDAPVPKRTAGLSPATVKALLARYGLESAEFGQPGPSTVMVSHGDQLYVLKVYNSSSKTLSSLVTELDFTQYLLTRHVPVTKPVACLEGGLVAQATTGRTTWFGVLMEFEPGAHPQAYSPALLRHMAAVQARIHLGGITYATDYAHDNELMQGRSLKSSLLGAMPKGISHFDFDGSNLLTLGDKVSCVLDFEGMRYDPIVVCTFFTLSQLYDTTHDRKALGTYLKAYQKVRRLTWSERLVLRVGLAMHCKSPGLLLFGF